MTGYVRQSAADIVATEVIRATPINNELNAIRDAFSASTGHRHDGTAAEGTSVPVIGDLDFNNKIAVDTVNNRHGVFVEVGGSPVEQIRFVDGAILPVTNNDIDFGSSSFRFKDGYAAGTFVFAGITVTSADINGGTLDNVVIGASTAAAATVTNLTVNTAATIASADINAGTIDGAVIGGSSAQAITGTTVTATVGFVGGLTGNVTGNTTGTHTGAVTGDVTGNVTGNVTASSGTSTFNDVVINGNLNMNAGTSATITNLSAPTNNNDAATKVYVDTSISNLVASAPGLLDTLDELAAALGDDPNFATTVTNSIATKLALSGGTMSGAIAMGTNKITGLGNPTANQDAATKTYVDTADALLLPKAGGTMSGAIAMGTNKITGLGDPTLAQDAATKNYIDVLYGSTASAATSAAAAATSASNAATSASSASTSASTASTAASNAAASYDAFDDRYLGSKVSAPSVDNDGNALLEGALYWNSTSKNFWLWNGSAWTQATLSAAGFLVAANNLSDLASASTARTNLAVAGTGVSNTFSANQIISVTDNTNAALRVTQLGSGNAILVEDSANPDSTPFVVTTNGRAVVGHTAAITGPGSNTSALQTHSTSVFQMGYGGTYWAADATGAGAYLAKSRGATIGTRGIVSNGDSIGRFTFAGDDGTNFLATAIIESAVDGTPGTNDMPGRLVFSTTADGSNTSTERMRIDNAGNVTFRNAYTETVYALSGTDINPANGTIQTKTLGASTTFTESLADGQSVVLMVNPSTYTVTWPTMTWINTAGSGSSPTLKASAMNVVAIWQVAGTVYGNWVGSA